MQSIIVKWLVEERIALLHYVSTPTLAEVDESTDRLVALINSGQAPVHVISHIVNIDNIPTDLASLKKSMQSHPKSGFTVIISDKPVARFIGSVLTGMLGGKAKAFNNLQDGLAYLQSMDDSLPEISNLTL